MGAELVGRGGGAAGLGGSGRLIMGGRLETAGAGGRGAGGAAGRGGGGAAGRGAGLVATICLAFAGAARFATFLLGEVIFFFFAGFFAFMTLFAAGRAFDFLAATRRFFEPLAFALVLAFDFAFMGLLRALADFDADFRADFLEDFFFAITSPFCSFRSISLKTDAQLFN